MPDHPAEISPSSFTFIFPEYNGRLPYPNPNDQLCPAVHYVVRPWGVPLRTTGRIRLRGAVQLISGKPTFGHQTESDDGGTAPAAVRLFIQRKGDDLTKDTYRWWSNPRSVPIRIGPFDMTVQLIPGEWSSVFGHLGSSLPGAFVAALNDPMRIGMTCGGGDDFGHGVFSRGGKARLIVRLFGVTPS